MNKYKYNELHGKIIAKFGTLGAYANALKIHPNSVTNKLTGDTPWKEREISKTRELLGFSESETTLYFLL